MIEQMRIQQMIARCDQLIAKNETRLKEHEAKARQFEAWLNLYEVCPIVAKKNPHMGIIVNNSK